MIRVPTPADLNETTSRFPRTLDEAFLCDARRANAFERFDVCGYGAAWWTAMALIAVAGAVVIVATA